jgi:putative membrane protein
MKSVRMTISTGLASFVLLLHGSPLQAGAKNVLNDLHHVNQMRIQVGRLAEQKGDSNEVKDVARRLINDYERADREVIETAAVENVRLKTLRFGWSEKQTMKDLESASGKDFYLIFALTVANNIRKDIDQLESVQNGLKPRSASYELVSRLLLTARMKDLSKKFWGWGFPSYDLGRPR